MDPLAIAASGIRSAQQRLAASAHNVANLTTPAFRPLETVQSSVRGGGAAAITRQAASPGEVDLSRELVEQILARTQFQGSLRVISVASEMHGSLVDLLA
jgi:flagellar basal-body rod protein FlgC